MGKHGLRKHVTKKENYTCDKCGTKPPIGIEIFCCTICNWDICAACYSSNGNAMANTSVIQLDRHMNNIDDKGVNAIVTSLEANTSVIQLDRHMNNIDDK